MKEHNIHSFEVWNIYSTNTMGNDVAASENFRPRKGIKSWSTLTAASFLGRCTTKYTCGMIRDSWPDGHIWHNFRQFRLFWIADHASKCVQSGHHLHIKDTLRSIISSKIWNMSENYSRCASDFLDDNSRTLLHDPLKIFIVTNTKSYFIQIVYRF